MDRQGFAEMFKGLLTGLMASPRKLIQLEELSSFKFGALVLVEFQGALAFHDGFPMIRL